MFFADFAIENGIQVPKFQVGENAYPTLELFDDNFEYIKTRANKVQNPKYKAKYNHLLWLSPQKHIDFAKQAIDSYLFLLINSSFSVTFILLLYFEKYEIFDIKFSCIILEISLFIFIYQPLYLVIIFLIESYHNFFIISIFLTYIGLWVYYLIFVIFFLFIS